MNEYWMAIKEQDAKRMDEVLRESPDTVYSSINSNPWKLEPDDSYSHKTMGVHVCSFSGRERCLEILLNYRPDLEAITLEENKGLTTPLVLAA